LSTAFAKCQQSSFIQVELQAKFLQPSRQYPHKALGVFVMFKHGNRIVRVPEYGAVPSAVLGDYLGEPLVQDVIYSGFQMNKPQ